MSNNELTHHGVKGMRWGVITNQTKNITDNTSQIVRTTKNSINKKSEKKSRMDLSSMTDKELREKINRELLERQYSKVFEKEDVGRQRLKKILDAAETGLAITGSSLAIALSIQKMIG